jgi:hypothetical protein
MTNNTLTSFKRKFKEIYQTSFANYIKNKRLKKQVKHNWSVVLFTLLTLTFFWFTSINKITGSGKDIKRIIKVYK